MSDFELASRACTAGLALVESVARHGKAGRIDEAYGALQSIDRKYASFAPVIAQYGDQLAAQSDGPVVRGLRFWSSAHEAAAAICELILERLFFPAVSDIDWDKADQNAVYGLHRDQVIDAAEQRRRAECLLAERWEEFNFEPEWILGIHERMNRERAKLLATVVPPADDANWPTQTDVAERLGTHKTAVARLIKDGELKDNGKKLTERRVDPASILAYVHNKGIVYNDKDDDR